MARVQDSEVVYVQNRTFTSTHTVTGENIMVGEKVTTAQPQGKGRGEVWSKRDDESF